MQRAFYIANYTINNKLIFLKFCFQLFLDGSKWHEFYPSLYILFRVLTYKCRVLPNVFILGEQKCGTTTAAYYLRKYLNMKGPFTFCNHPIIKSKDSLYYRGLYDQYASFSYYSMCFPLKWFAEAKTLYFDACPSGLFLPFIRDRIHKLYQDNPHHLFKFIIFVRDPIDRAISAAKAEVSYGQSIFGKNHGIIRKYGDRTSVKELVDFCESEAFNKCLESLKCIKWNERLPVWYPTIARNAFIQRGKYHKNIEWFYEIELFKNNTLILDLKDLSHSPAATIKKIANFVGINTEDIDFGSIQKAHLNKSHLQDNIDELATDNALKVLREIYEYDYKTKLNQFM